MGRQCVVMDNYRVASIKINSWNTSFVFIILCLLFCCIFCLFLFQSCPECFPGIMHEKKKIT